MSAISIRFVDPDTTPSTYVQGGWVRTEIVMQDDHWTVRGPDWALCGLVERAQDAANIDDLRWVEVERPTMQQVYAAFANLVEA